MDDKIKNIMPPTWKDYMIDDHLMLIDKPVGPTSFGVIHFLRKQLHIKKIGHAGTLDPFASGLLIIGITRAGTRQMQDFVGLSKKYRVHILLGSQTDTGDCEGTCIKEMSVPQQEKIDKDMLALCADIVGDHAFPVPLYSAIKVDGKPLYWYARKGIAPPRIPVKDMRVLSCVYHGMVTYPNGQALDMTLEVSSGSYIRTLGEYIASLLGTVGQAVYLRRTSIGDYHVDHALPLAYTEKRIHHAITANQNTFTMHMKNRGIVTIIILIILIGAGLIFAKNQKAPESHQASNMPDTQTSMNETPENISLDPTHTITMNTSAGPITLELYGKAAPVTVNNFVTLAQEGFYDDTRFHRIIEGFMIQGGDPNTRGGSEEEGAPWGTGGPGYTFEDELMRGGLTNEPGTLAMANAGPGTNGSQFFINVADNSNLDTRHTVFGRVIEGMDTVMGLSQVATLPNDRPEVDVVLEGVEVITLSTAVETEPEES